MAEIKEAKIQSEIIDLSGKLGLADKWYGELISPTQGNSATNYTTKNGEMMAGGFNPIKRKGYLSPNVNTFLPVTAASSSFASLMVASEVDEINEDVYFFDNDVSGRIWRSTDFDQLVLTPEQTLGAKGYDFAVYTVNDNRSLFYTFSNTVSSFVGVRDITATASPTFTADAGSDFITWTGGDWTGWDNRAIKFTTTGTLPAPLSISGTYYIVGLSGTSSQVESTIGGGAIDITDAGTGTHSISLYLDDTGLATPPPPAGAPKLIPAGDGFMYLLAKNKVYRYDGTSIGGANGTWSSALLTAPGYYNFSHGLDHRGNLYMVVQKNKLWQDQELLNTNSTSVISEVGVYIWNRQSTFFNTSDFVPIKGVRSIHAIFVADNGKIRIICRAANRTTQIREYNGSRFQVIKELGLTSYPNYEDSVAIVNGYTVWQGSDTRLYYYGAEKEGVKDVLFHPATLGTITTSFGGAIAYADGGTLQSDGLDSFYANLYDGSNYVMKKVSPHSDGTFNSVDIKRAVGNPYIGTRLLPRFSTVKHIDIYMAKLGTHTTTLTTVEATVSIYFNQSGIAWATKNITKADLNKGLFSIEVNQPYVNSIQMSIANSANKIGNTDFCPSHAVVEYRPTTTLGNKS